MDGSRSLGDKDAAVRPRTTEARRIGTSAEALFNSACANLGWVVTKTPLESDFGIDFRIEPTAAHSVDGIEFYAQVKGTSASDATLLSQSVRISAQHCEYWRAKLVPVAVVCVNLAASSIHYGWFTGSTRDSAALSQQVKIDHEFPVDLLATLEEYYRAVRAAAVRSSALDTWLSAAVTLCWALARRAAIDAYPQRFAELEAQHEDSRFTKRQIQDQVLLMAMGGSIAQLSAPIMGHMPGLDRALRCRDELLRLWDRHYVAQPMKEMPGLKVPAAAAILLDSFRTEDKYALYLATELAGLLVQLRSDLAARPLEVFATRGPTDLWITDHR